MINLSKIKINTKDILYQLLYIACIGISYLGNYELTFLVWSFAVGVTIKRTYSIEFLKFLFCFVIIISLAFVVSLFHDYKKYEIIRDSTYLLKPIIGLLAGYQLCRYNSKSAFKLFVNTGLIIALIHLSVIIITLISHKTLNVNVLRDRGGFFSDYEIYVLILLIFHKKFNLGYTKAQINILILIIAISSFLYLSRTNLIQFVLFFIALKGYFEINRKSILVLSTVVLSTLIAYSAILYSNPKRNGKGIEAFLYKVKIAPIEPFKTKINKSDWKDFNDNYRSYENIITVRQVSAAGNYAVFFGEGLGSTLDLGRKVLSNDGDYVRKIPIVHNGYMTVFLKSGIVGVIILIISIVILFRQKKSPINLVQNINYLLIGTSIFLIVSNWVFLGLYLKLDNKSIVIGFLFCLKLIAIKESNSQRLELKNEELQN